MKSAEKRILVVDDDPDIIKSFTMILECEGYNVDTAKDGVECMQKVAADPPDLILLDIMMERMTEGFHVGHKLRSDPKTKKIPILMISALSQETGFNVASSMKADYVWADDFVDKPIKAEVLLEKVSEMLKNPLTA